MNQFFEKYETLQHLRPLFESSVVANEDFYTLSDTKICELLRGNNHVLIEFISKFSFERGQQLSACLMNNDCMIEHMDVSDFEHENTNNNASNNTNDSASSSPNAAFSSNTEISESTPSIPSEIIVEHCFEFVKNELYDFLNSSFEGRIVLDKYKFTKQLDYFRFKYLIIMHKIQEDPIKYKISKDYFKRISELAIELFPTEDITLFFSPRTKVNNEEKSAGGCLYTYYKAVRAELRLARILPKKTPKAPSSVNKSKEVNIGEVINVKCLTDPKRENYTSGDVITHWEQTYTERCTLLDRSEKNVKLVSIKTYFKTFACLDAHLSVILLESDFQKTIQDLQCKNLIEKETEFSGYNSLFSQKWPIVAKAVVSLAKKSRNDNVKLFINENKDLFATDEHNSLLALFLIPLTIKTVKSIKLGNQNVVLTKEELSKAFILHVQEPVNIEEEIRVHEQWLQERNIEILPYLLFCHNLPCSRFYIVINGEKYLYSSCEIAVDNCFKFITALRRLPYLSDYVWSFIERAVYKFTYKRSISQYVTQYVVKVNKLL